MLLNPDVAVFTYTDSTVGACGDSKKLLELLESIKANVDARKYDFVDPIPKEVQTECSICLCIVEEAYIVSCCGYRFCKMCIEKVTFMGQPCPMCKERHFQKIPDKQLQRLLDQRIVYCLLKDDGCTWKGEVCKLRSHLQVYREQKKSDWEWLREPPKAASSKVELPVPPCEYMPVTCTPCKSVMRRLDKKSHEAVCMFIEVKCEHCNEHTCPRIQLSLHYNSCPDYVVSCPNKCTPNATFKRKDLKQHIEDDCPLQVVECEYQFAGCTATMIRKDMPDHMENSTKEHLSMLSSKYQQVNAEYETFKEHTLPTKNVNNIEYVYVSNLAEETTEGMLQSRFGQFGGVVGAIR